jgi:alanyl-tRNA synthetase
MEINKEYRNGATIHHTANHIFVSLLEEEFIKPLGKILEPRGSLITNDKFRFDFNFDRALTTEEKTYIENKINNIIKDSIDIYVEYETLENAKKNGIFMLDWYDYEERVRVINIPNISYMLCGGTHLTNTKFIKNFKIVSEKGHGKGIRRIEIQCNF